MTCNNQEQHRWFPTFAGFTEFTPAIPKMYFDVQSVEQRYHTICAQLHKLICYVDYIGDDINLTKSEIEELKTLFNKFVESGFEDYYEAQLNKWIRDHMAEIIEQYVKHVFFGLTLDGNFVAYIPQGGAWDDVIFDTGQVYNLDSYGRLMLYYVTDANSDVWQDEMSIGNNLQTIVNRLSREVNAINGEIDDINEGVSNLDERITANETAINSPITEGDL